MLPERETSQKFFNSRIIKRYEWQKGINIVKNMTQEEIEAYKQALFTVPPTAIDPRGYSVYLEDKTLELDVERTGQARRLACLDKSGTYSYEVEINPHNGEIVAASIATISQDADIYWERVIVNFAQGKVFTYQDDGVVMRGGSFCETTTANIIELANVTKQQIWPIFERCSMPLLTGGNLLQSNNDY